MRRPQFIRARSSGCIILPVRNEVALAQVFKQINPDVKHYDIIALVYPKGIPSSISQMEGEVRDYEAN